MHTKYTTWPWNWPTLQYPQKFTQIGIFWFENVPSANPDVRLRHPPILRISLSTLPLLFWQFPAATTLRKRKFPYRYLSLLHGNQCEKVSEREWEWEWVRERERERERNSNWTECMIQGTEPDRRRSFERKAGCGQTMFFQLGTWHIFGCRTA
jgi:hypothetical protein